LLAKSRDYCLSELVAPRLHNVGIMLPYSGLHYMLFDKVDDSAFVMTSGNPPNQPIVNDNDEALRSLGNTVDYFLFHNRKIAHRCDDSVIRTHNGNTVMLRRSRGYAPAPVRLERKSRKCVVGLGGELNNTSCILNRDRAFISQHIGDVENIETRNFLEVETKHLIQLTNSKIDGIACDLHPRFTTTKLAHDLAEELGCELVQVQHHYAHLAALSIEHDLDEIVGICCDGYGYGSDGQAWGGEIIFCTREALGFKRLAHLEQQLLLGGDLSTKYPLRMVAGILRGERTMPDWLLQHKEAFPHGEQEIQVVLSQLQKGKGTIATTSCGRVLDAVSAVIGVCFERTYEGEPSMKLESIAREGEDVLRLKPLLKGNTLNTTQMVKEVYENRTRHHTADLAYSAHMYLAKGLAALAIEKANEKGVKTIGFSGGVAYNEIFSATLRRIIEHSNLHFLVHESVPPGDGGLSFGQAAALGFS
jgi:hydrogenase maturation protein HypF